MHASLQVFVFGVYDLCCYLWCVVDTMVSVSSTLYCWVMKNRSLRLDCCPSISRSSKWVNSCSTLAVYSSVGLSSLCASVTCIDGVQWCGHIFGCTPLATAHPRACEVQNGMSRSPVAVWAGTSLPGRWLLPPVRQHSALSTVSWHSDLRGARNIQQLRRQNFRSRWTSLVELSSCPDAQPRHQLWTV